MHLCNSIPKLVCENGFVGTEIHEEAIEICRKYKLVFSKYATCHNLMNAAKVFQEYEVQQLGKLTSGDPLKPEFWLAHTSSKAKMSSTFL